MSLTGTAARDATCYLGHGVSVRPLAGEHRAVLPAHRHPAVDPGTGRRIAC